MTNTIKFAIGILALLLLGNCSTYSIKHDGNKAGVVESVPDWYVDYKGFDGKFYQETGQPVSPDMELAIKKSILLAKAKLADRINGEMNNRTTIAKNEGGKDENHNVQAGAQDTIVNVISETVLQHYEVNKKVVYSTGEKSYRSYVMIRISKENVDKVISNVESRKNTSITPQELDKKAKDILDKKS